MGITQVEGHVMHLQLQSLQPADTHRLRRRETGNDLGCGGGTTTGCPSRADLYSSVDSGCGRVVQCRDRRTIFFFAGSTYAREALLRGEVAPWSQDWTAGWTRADGRLSECGEEMGVQEWGEVGCPREGVHLIFARDSVRGGEARYRSKHALSVRRAGAGSIWIAPGGQSYLSAKTERTRYENQSQR